MHTQTVLDFNLNLDVIARKDAFQKVSVSYQKIRDVTLINFGGVRGCPANSSVTFFALVDHWSWVQ